MVELTVHKSREEWLEARENTIGGSDAACILGMNPYKSNVELWEEKTGKRQPEDISDNEYVRYGTEAEAPLRDLFALDFPNYVLHYEENNMFKNTDFPWAHYSADGWLYEGSRFGIWECKTAAIMRAGQRDKWNDRLPDNYYIQVLHGMLIAEADFAVLKAQLKSTYNGSLRIDTRHYFIERSEVQEDIKVLKEAEARFYENMKNGTKPCLILPEI